MVIRTRPCSGVRLVDRMFQGHSCSFQWAEKPRARILPSTMKPRREFEYPSRRALLENGLYIRYPKGIMRLPSNCSRHELAQRVSFRAEHSKAPVAVSSWLVRSSPLGNANVLCHCCRQVGLTEMINTSNLHPAKKVRQTLNVEECGRSRHGEGLRPLCRDGRDHHRLWGTARRLRRRTFSRNSI
ncbi:hypothetical protein M2251_000242 [Rhodococcus erythropolis]|nr:hypothetical protein [Rhodococcus erythropolis]